LTKVDKRKYGDRRQYLIRAVHKRRKKIRTDAVSYKGGKCELCGYDRCIDAMEFHHNGSSEKDFSISEKGYTRSWTRVKEELDKCVLLCANCHRELHAKLAASGGNTGVKKRVNSGKPHAIRGNPEPISAIAEQVQRLDTRYLNSEAHDSQSKVKV